MIKVGAGRHRFGDYPEATLVALAELDPDVMGGEIWYDKAVAALKKKTPDADAAARAIVGRIEREHQAIEHKAVTYALKHDLEARREAPQEAAAIVDGAPPELPPPAMPEEPRRLVGERERKIAIYRVKNGLAGDLPHRFDQGIRFLIVVINTETCAHHTRQRRAWRLH